MRMGKYNYVNTGLRGCVRVLHLGQRPTDLYWALTLSNFLIGGGGNIANILLIRSLALLFLILCSGAARALGGGGGQAPMPPLAPPLDSPIWYLKDGILCFCVGGRDLRVNEVVDCTEME
jgi:hypothetical protein